MTRKIVALAAIASIASQPHRLPAADDLPRLVVMLVVDQMRADYIERFKSDWSAGLKRLLTDGAWFRNAAYPYLNTVTCAGHATIATGALPYRHGVIQNAWWDRGLRKPVTCTEDPDTLDVRSGVPVSSGSSAHRLQIPTFADEMRANRSARVVALSLKDRSAIMLAGRAAEAVVWQADTLDGWQISSAFGKPSPAVEAFLERNPAAADRGRTWTRVLPESRYQGADDALGEAPPRGWTRTFPHAIDGDTGQADRTFLARWQTSPFADAYLGRFAAALVESLQLGRHDGIDVLGVSFSSPDLIGHAFGPRSHEVQDAYAQLDRTIGALLDRLDALVGRNEYVVALSSDHGVASIPEQLQAEGKDAGRLNPTTISMVVEERLRSAFGDGTFVARVHANDVYFEPGVYEKLRTSPAALRAAMAAIQSAPGVAAVFRAEQLRGARNARDPLLRAAALGYFEGRSGDLVLVPKPGWVYGATGTSHGTANPDDQRVPIVFMGKRVTPGEYPGRATPADIAPTLAALSGIKMPHAEGRALLKSAVK